MKKKIIIDPTALENLKFEVLADLYSPDYLYNPDKTKLVCKALPHTTLVSKRKSSTPGISSLRTVFWCLTVRILLGDTKYSVVSEVKKYKSI